MNERDSQLIRHDDEPQTPYQRLLNDRLDADIHNRLRAQYAELALCSVARIDRGDCAVVETRGRRSCLGASTATLKLPRLGLTDNRIFEASISPWITAIGGATRA